MTINSYRDLRVWQAGIALAENCYRLTKPFPRDELYGLVAQMRRAAVSIPANIAEGYGRDSTGSYMHFLRVAQGSLKEVETHLILSERLGMAKEDLTAPILNDCEELGKMLRALIRKLEGRGEGGRE